MERIVVLSFNDEVIATCPVSKCTKLGSRHIHSKKFTYYKNELRALEATEKARKRKVRRNEGRKRKPAPKNLTEILERKEPKPEKIYPNTVAEGLENLKKTATLLESTLELSKQRIIPILYTVPKRGPDIWPLFKQSPDNVLTNRFPDMREYCFKTWMYSRLVPYIKKFPKQFDFIPKSWDLSNPIEYKEFIQDFNTKQTYILKPSEGSQGLRIALAQSLSEVETIIKSHKEEESLTMAQEYIASPKLLNGYKFDFRVYVLVEKLVPLTVHIFRDALTRFSTSVYSQPTSENMINTCMHLTNYYLNRDNEQWKESESKEDPSGTKRLITITLNQIYEESIKHNKKNKNNKIFNKDKFWKDLDSIVSKSLIAYHTDMIQSYNKVFNPSSESSSSESKSEEDAKAPFSKCYQVLGFDLMLDENDKLWLLEINQNPSMEINGNMVDDYLKRSISATTLEIIAKTNQGEEEKVESADLLPLLEKDKSGGEWRCIPVPEVSIQYHTLYPLKQYENQFPLS